MPINYKFLGVTIDKRKPVWLKANILGAARTSKITNIIHSQNLNTVCESARCPNRGECFEKGTAVFMILGNECTRNCRFCAIKYTTEPKIPDPNEPEKIAKLAKQFGLEHVIITSVTRDDLPDGGADHFAKTLRKIRKICNENTTTEVLTPDFKNNHNSIDLVLNENPTVFNHNLETIPRLYEKVRPQANYKQSLEVLKYARNRDTNIITKTGIMVGLGETQREVLDLLHDARDAGVKMLTIGQYLQADRKNLPVIDYIHPKIFDYYKKMALKMGFQYVESAPLVRSSYYTNKFNKIVDKIN
ncbi:MAG: lipoyl synthase [Candidatus Cloacimonadota bacterium]|nr:lipoyl synthase [Candidatus Cloacimonadota bacterium]